MKEKSIKKKLEACFLDVFPELSPKTVLKAGESFLENWDSIHIICLVLKIEKEFGITFDLTLLGDLKSFSDFLDYLEKK